jgi:hypothetical protein
MQLDLTTCAEYESQDAMALRELYTSSCITVLKTQSFNGIIEGSDHGTV